MKVEARVKVSVAVTALVVFGVLAIRRSVIVGSVGDALVGGACFVGLSAVAAAVASRRVVYRAPGIFFFRVYGYGLWFASYETHRPLYSERNGVGTALRFGGWRVRVLTPIRKSGDS